MMPYPTPQLGYLVPTRGLLLADPGAKNADLVLRLGQKAEDGGFDSVWVGDSLTAKPRLEPLSVLAALAARTNRVRLGTAVLLAALRHPVLLAQTLATVDLISKGRLIIAAGVGGAFNEDQVHEWHDAGVPASGRAVRLEEIVQIVKGLGSDGPIDFAGRHFQLQSTSMLPKPVEPIGIPLLLACHWRSGRDAQFRRAARLADGIISISDTPQEFAQLVKEVRGRADDMGRDGSALKTVMYITVNMDPDVAKGQADAENFLTGYYGSNIWGNRWGPFGGAENVKQRIAAYTEAGAQTVIVRFASFHPERQLDIFLENVVQA
jgi:alkanesulfonate monooxygenase SsuD/methylene tetrahydromethanopterin reductase-like flavin-dependent oxidoreductase (luciferase family)